MSQSHDQKCFTISQVAADWHELICTFIRQSRQHNIAGKKTDRERQTVKQTSRHSDRL